MHQYEEKKFNLPTLDGLSEKQLDVHLGLYAGYVKHVNAFREQIHDLEATDKEKYALPIAELRRRFSFEFDGMRMHEYYFSQFEEGPQAPALETMRHALSEKYSDWEGFLTHFKTVGMTRGIGWTVLYWDNTAHQPHVAWVGDHEIGQLAGLPVLLAMDMWEHAYMVDYTPSEKKQYIESFFKNLNWSVVESRFQKAQ